MLNAVDGRPDGEDDDFPLACVFVDCQHYFLPVVTILKNSHLFKLEHLHPYQEGLFESILTQRTAEILLELSVLDLQLLPGSDQC